MAVSIETRKSINLLKQIRTPNGKLNCYVCDTLDDLEWINETQIEIIGCRAYCIENGKFYMMNSSSEWEESKPYYDEELKDKVVRRGTYTWTFDPKKYDGVKTLEVEFDPTLQPFEETITRKGDYTFRYNKVDFDGWDDITLHVEPTLQDIEEEIDEGGDYVYEADPEEYDGLGKVTLHVTASGNGDKVAVDEDDKNPDYLANKLVSKEGSGIELNVIGEGEDKQLEMRFNMKDFEIEFMETLPFASMQQSMNPLYSHSSANLIASSVIPNYSFSFREGISKFVAYSDEGNIRNCRLCVLKLNSDNSITIIAYSEKFTASTIRDGSKLEAVCEWSNGEKIKGGQRYYFGIIGTLVDTAWLKMFGYQSWASKDMSITPPFNICTNYSFNNEPKNTTIPSNQIDSNSANAIYIGVTH